MIGIQFSLAPSADMSEDVVDLNPIGSMSGDCETNGHAEYGVIEKIQSSYSISTDTVLAIRYYY